MTSESFDVAITDGATRDLNGGARRELTVALERYVEDLVRESSRLEAAMNTTGKPEITGSMVKDADLLLRKGYRKPRKHGLLLTCQVAAPLLGFATGLLFDRQTLQTASNLLLFLIILTATIVTTVVVALRE